MNSTRQAELEGRHSQAGAWERDNNTKKPPISATNLRPDKLR